MQKRKTLVEMIDNYFQPLDAGHYLTVNSLPRFLILEFNWRVAEVDSDNDNSSTSGTRAGPPSAPPKIDVEDPKYLKALKVLEETQSWVCFQGNIPFPKWIYNLRGIGLGIWT